MSEKIIHINEGALQQELNDLVRTSVEDPFIDVDDPFRHDSRPSLVRFSTSFS
jgi:uncharacterized protein (DUF2461 family)